jgi:hypothetical protein
MATMQYIQSLCVLYEDIKMNGTGLKGPKLEIFGFRVFSQIRPVWVGDLGTRQKNSKF